MRTTLPLVWIICASVGRGIFAVQAADPAPLSATPTNSVAPPQPPMPKPQVSYFRELLALTPARLDETLARIPEAAQKKLRAKLQEYAALPPYEREARLRATELRWYIAPLLQTPPTNRVAQLAIVPDEFRPLVEERLNRWDALSPGIRKELQDNEWTIRYFVRPPASAAQPDTIWNSFPPELRKKLDGQLDAWLVLPAAKRQRMSDRFQRYFDLPPVEKEKTLSALSDAERHEMEDTLQAFQKLTPEQRRVCVSSFGKFANLSPEDRAQFLRNAERWKEMSAEDRRTWRTLVTKLPPLPPGFGEPPKPPLPRPPVSLTNAGP